MTEATGGGRAAAGDRREVVHLPQVAAELLEVARRARAGRAGRTLNPAAGAPLKQSVLALADGQSLADHESPAAATLQVLVGRVRLTAAGTGIELAEGDHAPIPPVRHGLDALEDAAVLISVAQGPGPDASPAAEGTAASRAVSVP